MKFFPSHVPAENLIGILHLSLSLPTMKKKQTTVVKCWNSWCFQAFYSASDHIRVRATPCTLKGLLFGGLLFQKNMYLSTLWEQGALLMTVFSVVLFMPLIRGINGHRTMNTCATRIWHLVFVMPPNSMFSHYKALLWWLESNCEH